ncbi:DNA-binding CsgD family transcriptional regulator/tetratricopeptide (TPR) repeat protein [Sphaerisporangium rubeum]|uniref:DNA-binding CsgD family transcriptional regulator/tetratricopeptide (TPR) repeat protein n=1 Tax=Sphaerisporangium rubeum TaxID=321317 RepID=A0A7X0M9A0_9ACTN|nr:DNA-binding CsgD family transcriptional regulator/tetratricopeptide (TPR) repeat protein [Sphaerisporangium rubeum]
MAQALRSAKTGRGGVVLVEGRSGAGKSRLLDLAAAGAAELGLDVARGAADEVTRLVPLAPLSSALGDPGLLWTGEETGATDQRLLMLERLRGPLERRVALRPMLLTLDDTHWADPMTLLALRSMTRDLASYPLVWMLARTKDGGDDRLFDVLERDGASRIALPPLAGPAVVEIVRDLLRAEPEADVLALTGLADGNPFLLTELIRRLRGEGVFEIADGHVRTVPARLPRVQAVTLERLRELSPRTRHLLQVASVLGRTFAVQDLAEMLGEPTHRLLPMLDEAMSAGIVGSAGEELAFRHHLLWQAVTGTVPPAVGRALHRDAGEMLLKRGGPAVPAAAHLLRSAGPGDVFAVRGLDQAAREVLRTSPQTAAELAGRVLELSDQADPEWPERAATAVDALTLVGRLTEAAELARAAMRRASSAQTPRLRCALAYILLLSARPEEALAEAEDMLAGSDLPEPVRDIVEWTVLWGLLSLNDLDAGRRRAATVLTRRRWLGGTAPVGARLMLSRFAMADGRVADAFTHLREAVRISKDGGALPAQQPYAQLMLCLLHRAVRQPEEADLAVRAAEEEIEAAGLTVLAAHPALFRAGLHLATGRLDDAADEARAAMTTAEELGIRLFIRMGLSMLALTAVRRGDVDAAVKHMRKHRSEGPANGMLFGLPWHQWVDALVTEAQGDRERAVEVLRATYTDARERRWAVGTAPLTPAWLTRLALDTGNVPYARAVVATAERLAGDNPGFPSLAAAAAHARGLLGRDPDALTGVVAALPQPWDRASCAEDAGVLLAADPGARDQAVAWLDQALDGYRRIGAQRDAARVRARLRALGVRRRHWAQPQRPPYGWDSLTDTERAVAGLIAQGMTNRQAAERMFLSPHTVSTHLRRMFPKLGVASRVELTRVVAEHCPSLLHEQ